MFLLELFTVQVRHQDPERGQTLSGPWSTGGHGNDRLSLPQLWLIASLLPLHTVYAS